MAGIAEAAVAALSVAWSDGCNGGVAREGEGAAALTTATIGRGVCAGDAAARAHDAAAAAAAAAAACFFSLVSADSLAVAVAAAATAAAALACAPPLTLICLRCLPMPLVAMLEARSSMSKSSMNCSFMSISLWRSSAPREEPPAYRRYSAKMLLSAQRCNLRKQPTTTPVR